MGREREREKETLICGPSHSCIHWLTAVYALTGDRTHILGASEGLSNKLSYPARATLSFKEA